MSVITKNPGLRQACTGFAFIHNLCSSIHSSIFCWLSFFALQGQLFEQRQLPLHPVNPGCACLGQDMPGILHPGNAQEASKSDDRTMSTGYFQYRIWQSNGPLLSTVVVLRDGPLILLWLERVTGKKSEGSLTSRLTLWNVIFSKHIRVMFRYLLICS